MKLINEGLGSIRDIILDNSQNFYLREYKKEILFRRAISQNSFYCFPKTSIEGIAIITLAIVAYFLSYQKVHQYSCIYRIYCIWSKNYCQ